MEALEPDRRLRLAEVPGRAWLELEASEEQEGGSAIRQTSVFDPAGLLGPPYWHASYPVHRYLSRVGLHTRHKLTLLAHEEEAYRRMGRLVAQAGGGNLREIVNRYGTLLMEALRVHATASKHANVLFHLTGYLKEHLDAGDKAELAGQIEGYRKRLVPLIVPITLLLHHFRRHPVDWVMEQTYLSPYPAELLLRNHV